MPTERSNGRYYVQRKVPGIGDVYRSLRTDRKAVARRREDAVLALAEAGRQDVVRAWIDGDVTIAALHEAHAGGTVHELAAEVRRDDATLADACRAALQDRSPDVADETLSGYETGLRRLRSFVDDAGIGDGGVRGVLTTDAVQQFKAWCADRHDVAPETVNNYLTAVSVLVTYAERRGWIDARPEIRKHESTVRISYLEADDLASYFAELRPRFRPLMRVLVGTGMRLGEAEALTPSDLRIGNGEARAAVDDAKTPSGVRTVFLSAAAAEAVRAHVARHGPASGEPIFAIPRRTVQKEHDAARGRIGRPGYTIHDHRHTAAVHLARAGMPLHLLRQQLGHSNVEQTMRYARFHPDYGDVAEYFDRVDRRLGLAAPGTPAPDDGSDNTSDNTPAPDGEEVAGAASR